MNCPTRIYDNVGLTDLKPAAKNARTHSDQQITLIAKSIQKFGWTNPLLIDDDNNVLAGHGRLQAAKKLGLAGVPCIRLSGMSRTDIKAYILADNRLAEKAGWDKELLAIELQELSALKYDIEITGFDKIDFDGLLTDLQAESVKPNKSASDLVPALETIAVTRLGDVWELGRHLLLCGDATAAASYSLLMGETRADMVFTDAPYNTKITGNVSGHGSVHHREFLQASGEKSPEEYTRFLSKSFRNMASVAKDGAIVFACMDWRHIGEMIAAGTSIFSEWKNLCVWSKTNAGMGSFYRSQHELVFVWKVGTAPHTNNFGLGDKGRHRTNVWSFAGVNTFKPERGSELAMHPTVKPVALIAEAIRDVSHRGEIVLDPFAGSGSTLMAAQKTGRVARVMELDLFYCDVIIRRFEKATGKIATLKSSGQSFGEVAAMRDPKIWGSNKPADK